jgi:hypothetical protein
MKIKITSKQYNNLLLREQNERLTNKLLNENINGVLMGFSKIIGVNLTNRNKIEGDKAIEDSAILLKIKNTLEDKTKLDSLVDALETKGMENAKTKLATDSQKIINDLNDILIKNNLENVGMSGLINLQDLDKSTQK